MGRILALLLASFPPPSVVPLEPSLKYDHGRVERVEGDRLVVVTVIGSVTFSAGAAVIIGEDGERHDPAELGRLARPSTQIDVWYVFAPSGPAAREIQLGGPKDEEWRPFERARCADAGPGGGREP